MNIEYKCPKCGGTLSFDSNVQNVKCAYCSTEFPIETFQSLDEELNGQVEDNINFENETAEEYSENEIEGMLSYVCESCGAEVVTAATTAATSCPYCDNRIILQGNLKGDLKPELVIPFKYDKQAAMDGFAKHMEGKKLLPAAFMANNHLEEIKGVYVPFWFYDSTADASIRYDATAEHTYEDGDYEVKVQEHYSVFRAGEISFENVPVDGSKKLPNDLTESVEPYDLSEAVPFSTAYLAGFYADKYDVTEDECSARAGDRMKNSTAKEFMSTVTGYTWVTTKESHINIKSGKAKYALLPVWLLTTTWNDEKYTFAMNGQTGKFVGNLPCDKSLKTGFFFKTFGKWAGIVAAVWFLFAFVIYVIL